MSSSDNKIRVALVVSHPIQHFCPQYVSFAENINIAFKVFSYFALGLRKYYDPNFKKEISWENLKLDQFDHVRIYGQDYLERLKECGFKVNRINISTISRNVV